MARSSSSSVNGPDTPAVPPELAPTIPALPSCRGDVPEGGTLPPEALDLLAGLQLSPAGPPTDPTDFAAATPAPYPLIAGYEILEEIGHGGMGVVYKAREIALNRLVALKMIAATGGVSNAELLRFLAEAEAVAAVKHPNVVEVYHLGRHAGRPFFAMEFVGGGTLAQRLAAGRLKARETAAVVAAIARGVQAIHAQGIVHRDLKPGNVLLGDRRQETGDSKTEAGSSLSPVSCPLSPKVGDFGLAKRLGAAHALTRSLAVMGTPAYMAPEQADGQAKFVGPEADLYALGVILYECLTGTRPFDADNPVSLLRRVVDEIPISPRKRLRSVPRDLELICLQCLEKQPHHRYTTAAELADDLDRFLAGKPVTVRPVSVAARLGRWGQRYPAHAALVVILLATVFGLPPIAVLHRAELATSRATAKASDVARLKAEEARVAAEKLAAARELFALQSTIRERSVDRPTGWTWANRADAARAANRAGGDPGVLAELRSELAAALLAQDLRPVESVANRLTAAAVCPCPDGSVVAIGEFKAWGPLLPIPGLPQLTPARVLLVDPATGATGRELRYPTAMATTKDGGPAQDGTRSAAFSPDGKRLFVGVRTARIVRFDLGEKGNKPAAEWKTRPGEVTQLAVSPDGTAVYAITSEATPLVRLDAESGRELGRFDSPHRVRGFAVEPGTGDLIVSDAVNLHRVDPVTMKPRLSVPVEPGEHAGRLAFAGGGRVLLVVRGNHLDLADPVGLRFTTRFTDPALRRSAHEEGIEALAVHPCGAFVATASSGDTERQVRVWAIGSTWRVGSAAIPGTGPVALAWSRDGRFLLVTAPGQTLRFEFGGADLQRFTGFHPYPLEAAAFAPEGDRVAALTEAAPGATGTLLLTGRDGTTTTAALPPWPESTRPGVAVASGRAVLATGRGTGLRLWNPAAGTVQDLEWTPHVARLPRFSPDGSVAWAVVESYKVQAWDYPAGTSRGIWSNALAEFLSGLRALDALAVGPTRAVVGGRDGTVHVLDTKVRRTALFPRPGDPVLAVAIAPDESFAVAGTRAGQLRVIRLADGTELPATEAHTGGVTAAALGPDGLLVTGGKDRSVRVWRRGGDGFEPLFTVAGLAGPVRGLEFGPSGNRLLVLLAGEHAVRIWDLDTLKTRSAELGLGW